MALNLVSLALDPGKRKNDHLPGKHLLVELVATVFNWWVKVDHLVGNPQLMDNILGKENNMVCFNKMSAVCRYSIFSN